MGASGVVSLRMMLSFLSWRGFPHAKRALTPPVIAIVVAGCSGPVDPVEDEMSTRDCVKGQLNCEGSEEESSAEATGGQQGDGSTDGAASGGNDDGGSEGNDSVGSGGNDSAGSGGTPALCDPPPAEKILCVFDYDLTISASQCESATSHCRTNSCGTYGWYDQCLSADARSALARCVERGAYIGIASHAEVDQCWEDKVLPIIDEEQFPELTSSTHFAAQGLSWSYPALDDRDSWNCETCAYHMNANLSKPDGIRRIMRHYGMDPNSSVDRARVIFWDDSPTNADEVSAQLPEARTVLVGRRLITGEDGGCGITAHDIDVGWEGLAPSCAP